MMVGTISQGLGLLAQVSGMALLLVVLWPCCRWFQRRWDRLTRHRFVRWHRGCWREETDGHMALYQDAICRCCGRHWTG